MAMSLVYIYTALSVFGFLGVLYTLAAKVSGK